MRDVLVSYAVSDLCDSSPDVWLTVVSSEADSGLGGGDLPNDVQVVSSSLARVRAERFSKAGRPYTITVHARDDSGNESSKTVVGTVPQNPKK